MAKMMLDENLLEAYGAVVKSMPLRRCYEFMQILTELKDVKDVPEAFVALKRRIRKLNKEAVDYLDGNRIIKEYGIDGYVYREVLKATSMEKAEDEFEDYHRRTYIPSIYDCTGQAFTEWHKIFVIRGKYVLYHSVGFDV